MQCQDALIILSMLIRTYSEYRAELSSTDKSNIYCRYINGDTQQVIANDYGVCRTTIGNIIREASCAKLQ